MNYVDYRISLDVSKTVSSVVLNAKRKDSGRRISITLTEGTSAYPIAEDCSAVFTARKPDGNVVYNNCTVEAGIICCRVTEQLTAVAGVVSCEIKLFSAAGEQLTGALFYLAVEETVFEEGDIPGSASEIGVVADIVEQAKNAVTESGETLLRARNAAQAATQAVQTAQKVITDAEQAAKTAQAAAQRAEGASETAYTALQTAQEADRKVDTLREAVSSFHANIECTAEGDRIHLTDSAEAPLQGLRVCGRTTQAGTPSPEAPIPLVSAGDGGTITVTAAGKNLCPGIKVGTYSSVTGEYLSSFTDYRCTEKIACSPGQIYAFSNNLNRLYGVAYWDAGGSYLGTTYGSIDIPSAACCMAFVIDNTALEWAQCELGPTATEYEPYKGSTLTLSTPNGLPGIPVDSGGNYTDGAGQQWVCDYVDLAAGKLVQHICEMELDGETNGRNLTGSDGTFYENGFNYAYVRPLVTMKPRSAVLSNAFPFGGHSPVSIKTPCLLTTSVISVMAPDSETGITSSDTEAQKIAKINAWLASFASSMGETVKIRYIRNTPVETALSEEALAEYAKLHTRKLNTTIYNDAGADMEVTYLADTKTYIDNKFDQLALALVSST